MTDTSNSRTPMYSEREHQLARVQGSKGNESVRFKSSMSVDERYDLIRSVTDICFNNGGVTKPMADKLADFIEQYVTKKRIEEANQ